MNVVSLFDGCSMAQVALDRLGLRPAYYASEIDKYAIRVAMKNYPDTIQVGDVQAINPFDLPARTDLLIGGSPCQGLSVAGQQRGVLDDERSKLFFEFVRWKRYLKPRYFLLENVARMRKFDRFIMTQFMGVEPIMIDSALVSAQMRKRLYWTNIPNVVQPEDRGIILADILEEGEVDREKSFCLDAHYWKGTSLQHYALRHKRQVVFPSKGAREEFRRAVRLLRLGHGYVSEGEGDYYKYPTLAAQSPGTKYKLMDNGHARILTPVECERLQTLPDNYTEGVSRTQRYTMLGNGFTVEVIKHILSFAEW